MHLADLDLSRLRFQTAAEADEALRTACTSNPDVAACEAIGESEEGRPILGVTLGYGPAVVTSSSTSGHWARNGSTTRIIQSWQGWHSIPTRIAPRLPRA